MYPLHETHLNVAMNGDVRYSELAARVCVAGDAAGALRRGVASSPVRPEVQAQHSAPVR